HRIPADVEADAPAAGVRPLPRGGRRGVRGALRQGVVPAERLVDDGGGLRTRRRRGAFGGEGNGRMIRMLTRTTQVVLDIVVLGAALALAFFLRFDWSPPPAMLHRLALSLPYVIAVQYALLTAFGVPRFAWRYVGLRE